MSRWTKEQLEEIDQCREEGHTWNQIGERFGTAPDNVRMALSNAKKRGFNSKFGTSRMVPDGQKVKSISTLYAADGQVKAQWIKSTEDAERQQEIIRNVYKEMVEELPAVQPTKGPSDLNKDSMVAYTFGDPHFGMLSWAEETGENFDLDIAETIFSEGMKVLLDASPDTETGVLVNLGDFFHRDGVAAVTTRNKHLLDVDGRYAKMVQVAMRTMRYMIAAMLEKHEKVRIINAIGNHDDASAMFLSIALAHIYDNEPRISVDTSPSVFHYLRFGKTLLGIHHGHTCKLPKLPGVMATDRASDWGETQYRYWLTGHVHHQQIIEYPGCVVETFNTLAAKDEYAHSGGYRAGRNSKAMVYHKEFGEIGRTVVNVDMIKHRLKGE